MSTTTPKPAAPEVEKTGPVKPKKPNSSGDDSQTSSDYYFDSYSHFGIHEEMLKDTVRTETYMKAIKQNKNLFKDKVVLDIGCGTGILCLFAAQAGAKKVYGIECASIAKHARNIVKANNFENKIEIIRGKVEEIELPVEKVDIIVSEWMGYFLLYESMLDTVLFARDKWLVEGGILMPDKGSLYLNAIEDSEYYADKIDFWDSVYGFDMSTVKEDVINEPLVDCVEPGNVCSQSKPILEIDLYKCTKADCDFAAKVQLNITRNEYVHALCAFFTIEFSKCHTFTGFSTGPSATYTHWKQTIFYLDRTLMASEGDTIDVEIAVNRNQKNHRDLDIHMKTSFKDIHQRRKYMMR